MSCTSGCVRRLWSVNQSANLCAAQRAPITAPAEPQEALSTSQLRRAATLFSQPFKPKHLQCPELFRPLLPIPIYACLYQAPISAPFFCQHPRHSPLGNCTGCCPSSAPHQWETMGRMLPSVLSPTLMGQLGRHVSIHYQLMQWNWLTMGEGAAKIQHAACRCPWEQQTLLEDLCRTKSSPQFASDAPRPSLEEGVLCRETHKSSTAFGLLLSPLVQI